MSIWTRKNKSSSHDEARSALYTKEIADDLMAQITGGQGKSGCHSKLELSNQAELVSVARIGAISVQNVAIAGF